MATDLIRYDLLVQDALRSVVRKVLADTARNGLVGDHHFNIAFKTQAPGVVAPPVVKQRFPDEMSIILQHEFWDLVVTQDAFEVSLNFSRKPERLIVPFDFDHRLHRSVCSVRIQARAARFGDGGSRAGRGGKGGASEPGRGKAGASQAVRTARLRPEVCSECGKAHGASQRNEGRVDRRLPQKVAEAPSLAEIVNLRRARKLKERERSQAEAAQNRAVFGRSKAEKRLIESERALAEASLDARRLAKPDGD